MDTDTRVPDSRSVPSDVGRSSGVTMSTGTREQKSGQGTCTDVVWLPKKSVQQLVIRPTRTDMQKREVQVEDTNMS